MRTVIVAKGSSGKYQQSIQIGPHAFIADEPTEVGGDDAGPTPHEILLSSLGACTSITLHMYASRKGWALRTVTVGLEDQKMPDAYVIKRTIHLEGDLTDEQRSRLLEIANRCPVHKTLTGEIRIESALAH
jgi:putative redox protein